MGLTSSGKSRNIAAEGSDKFVFVLPTDLFDMF